MGVGTTTNYTETTSSIIESALQMITVLGANETASDDDYSLGFGVLNRLIKHWEAQGIHLWAKGTATLFFQNGQRQYNIYSSGDHATNTFYQTTLSTAASLGDTVLQVTSSASFVANDNIGIQMDNNYLFWTTIVSVDSPTQVTITSPLTYAVSAGKIIYVYTTRLDQPTLIHTMNRVTSSSTTSSIIQVPMINLSYQDYFELPNKNQTGTPVNYNYDRQRDYGVLSVWLVPQDVNYYGTFTYQRKIQDFDNSANNADFPQEWMQCLIENLAVKLSQFYGKNTGETYQALLQQAAQSLDDILGFDNEQGSLFIRPNYQGHF